MDTGGHGVVTLRKSFTLKNQHVKTVPKIGQFIHLYVRRPTGSRGQSDSSMVKVLALHMYNLGLIPEYLTSSSEPIRIPACKVLPAVCPKNNPSGLKSFHPMGLQGLVMLV